VKAIEYGHRDWVHGNFVGTFAEACAHLVAMDGRDYISVHGFGKPNTWVSVSKTYKEMDDNLYTVRYFANRARDEKVTYVRDLSEVPAIIGAWGNESENPRWYWQYKEEN
jgi:hypothetical protein